MEGPRIALQFKISDAHGFAAKSQAAQSLVGWIGGSSAQLWRRFARGRDNWQGRLPGAGESEVFRPGEHPYYSTCRVRTRNGMKPPGGKEPAIIRFSGGNARTRDRGRHVAIRPTSEPRPLPHWTASLSNSAFKCTLLRPALTFIFVLIFETRLLHGDGVVAVFHLHVRGVFPTKLPSISMSAPDRIPFGVWPT